MQIVMKSEMISPQEEKQHVPMGLEGRAPLKSNHKAVPDCGSIVLQGRREREKKRTPKGMEPLGVGRHMQLKHKHTGLCVREMY